MPRLDDSWYQCRVVNEPYEDRWTNNYTTTTYNYITTWSNQTITTNSTWSMPYTTTGLVTYSTSGTRGDGWVELGYTDENGIREQRYAERAAEVTEEARQRAQEAEQRRQTAERERAVARAEAKVVAEALLLSLLTEEQRATYAEDGWFEVLGSCGGVYRIHNHSSNGNVHWMVDGEMAARICAHPEMRECWLPQADVMIGQMLAITTDEAAFVEVANVHTGRRPDHEGLTRRSLRVAAA